MSVSAKQWLVLAALMALCLTVGATGGFATSQSVGGWYLTINRPAWNPPSWVFAPVWTVLYIMMAVAAWLVWIRDARFAGVRLALVFFFAQLFFNFLWAFIFFSAHAIGWALADIVILWVLVALTAWAFFGVSRLAGALMLPYLAWTSFAGFLNFTIWQMN
jgi:translocator protein